MSASRSQLPIYDHTNLDYTLKGDYLNWHAPLRVCASLKILPFITPNVEQQTGLTVNTFQCKQVKFVDGVKSFTGTNYTLTGLNANTGTTYTNYYFSGLTDQALMEVGLYQYYIKITVSLTTIAEFYSSVFYYSTPLESYTVDGDFNNDFNNDFYIAQAGGGGGAFTGLIIKSQVLPNIYPTLRFQDVMYLHPDDTRIVKAGIYVEDFLTSESYTTTIDPSNNFQRRIQSVMYEKYELSIITDESHNLQLLQYADNVNIIDIGQNVTYRMKTLEFSEEKLGTTNLKLCRFTFFDSNPANYTDNTQPASDFLKSDKILYNPSQYNSLVMTTTKTISPDFTALGNTYTFKTLLNAKKAPTEKVVKEATLGTGLKTYSRLTSQQAVELTFYLGQTEADYLNYLLMFETVQWYENGLLKYDNIERMSAEITKIGEAVDLYEAKIIFKIKNIDLKPYV